MQHFVETRLNLDFDTQPLFNWNTKQVFLSLTASYDSPRYGTQDVVVWDKIVRNDDEKRIRISYLRNKYGLREYSKSFENVTSLDFRIEWNVMPFVGLMQRGVTPRSDPYALHQDPQLRKQSPALLPY
ncbi:hypothetical protein MGL_1691 [Malassezia globosa CBS 7966]|uniref:Signal peptidase subunit 3 n=1 Tax=Malassezia globosa (strain ATCC MYA-4612 / CBS 7966) TaxID=425265 RepID=A8PYM8_MALGO|nr:uncharacterized protein MGL_1691 [Malassezia globosa CBS 7966]EDP44294.1 hypothetical protein MGL_1691 [Malassezia globosa CBS 7966]